MCAELIGTAFADRLYKKEYEMIQENILELVKYGDVYKRQGYGHAESVRRIINSKIQTQKQPFGNIQMAVFVFG